MSNQKQGDGVFPRLSSDSKFAVNSIGNELDPAAYVRASLPLGLFVGHSHPGSGKPALSCGLNGPLNTATKNSAANPLAATFESATGWTLGFDESPASRIRRENPALRNLPPTGRIYIEDMSADWPAGVPTAHRAKCDLMAASISDLVHQLQTARIEIAQLRAGLATGVPVSSASNPADLSDRLADLLHQLSEQAGAHASVIYLLDDDATCLNLAAATGLDVQACGKDFSQRELGACSADIEAMAGHAIVMQSPQQTNLWLSPIQCKSAICLPLATSSTILGTIWIFGDQKRDYTDAEINVLEIMVGRIAAEIETAAALRQLNGLWESADNREHDDVLTNVNDLMNDVRHMLDAGDVAGVQRAVDELPVMDGEDAAGKIETEFSAEFGKEFDAEFDKEFEAELDGRDIQECWTSIENQSLVSPPFEGWSLSGSTGCDRKTFLDWEVSDCEKICLIAGTDVENDAASIAVLVDPLTGEIEVQRAASGVSVWVRDESRNLSQPFDEIRGSKYLAPGASLFLLTTDDWLIAEQLIERSGVKNGALASSKLASSKLASSKIEAGSIIEPGQPAVRVESSYERSINLSEHRVLFVCLTRDRHC